MIFFVKNHAGAKILGGQGAKSPPLFEVGPLLCFVL